MSAGLGTGAAFAGLPLAQGSVTISKKCGRNLHVRPLSGAGKFEGLENQSRADISPTIH